MKTESTYFGKENPQLFCTRKFLEGRWSDALTHRRVIERALLDGCNLRSPIDFYREIAPQAGIILVAGGAGTRIKEEAAQPAMSRYIAGFGLDPDKSRALTPVPNLFDRSDFPFLPRHIYTLDYTLWAISRLVWARNGGNLTIVYGNNADLPEFKTVCERWGMKDAEFVKQGVHLGRKKPAGHGDALMWMRDRLKQYQYTMTVGNGDVTDPSMWLELLALHAFSDLSAVQGSTYMEKPTYAIEVNGRGIPTGNIGHDKLDGASRLELEEGLANIGNNAFRTDDLLEILDQYEYAFSLGGKYGPKGNEEFAIDHIVARIAQSGGLRQLCAFSPRAISSPAKSLRQLPGYLANQAENLRAAGVQLSEEGLREVDIVKELIQD